MNGSGRPGNQLPGLPNLPKLEQYKYTEFSRQPAQWEQLEKKLSKFNLPPLPQPLPVVKQPIVIPTPSIAVLKPNDANKPYSQEPLPRLNADTRSLEEIERSKLNYMLQSRMVAMLTLEEQWQRLNRLQEDCERAMQSTNSLPAKERLQQLKPLRDERSALQQEILETMADIQALSSHPELKAFEKSKAAVSHANQELKQKLVAHGLSALLPAAAKNSAASAQKAPNPQSSANPPSVQSSPSQPNVMAKPIVKPLQGLKKGGGALAKLGQLSPIDRVSPKPDAPQFHVFFKPPRQLLHSPSHAKAQAAKLPSLPVIHEERPPSFIRLNRGS